MRTSHSGFTLVEVLVISPIIILFIGTFIALLVSLTGESLIVREQNTAIHDSQAALEDMRMNITQATGFMTTTGVIQSPQGKDNATAAFTDTTGAEDALLLKLPATTASPSDASRSLIYTGTGACDSTNPIYNYYLVYFVALDGETSDPDDKAIYKRTILPQGAACADAWQRGSCAATIMDATPPSHCKMRDERLVGGVSTFDVKYYSGTVGPREDDAPNATDASVTIGVSKDIAGTTVAYSATVRAASVNVQTADTASTTTPTTPPITYSRSPSTIGVDPYDTTFTWDRVGNALNYTFEYTFTGGTLVQRTVAQTAAGVNPSTIVNGTQRKQAISVKVKVNSSAGTYDYGTTSATATPLWNDCVLQNGWTNWGGVYSGAGFTRTSSGLIGMHGLVRDGTNGATTPVCTLPPGFRPAQNLMFQVAGTDGGVNGAARVDIKTTGEVTAQTADSPTTYPNRWVSLSGIQFVASDAGYTWTDGSWVPTWDNYLGGWGTLKYTTDSLGRVHVEGLGKPGTLTAGTLMTSSLATPALKPSHLMYIQSRASTESAVNFEATGDIKTRGIGASYNSLNFTYFPSTFNSWTNLTLSNSWVPLGTTTSPAQCHKGSDDVVIVRGIIKSGTNAVFANPSSQGCGIHTDGRMILPAWMSPNSAGRINVMESGTLDFDTSSPTWTSIDNVNYIAD